MSRSHRPVALGAAVLAVLLAGCGGGGATGTTEAFCADFAEFSKGAALDGVGGASDMQTVMTALDALVKDAKEIRPPQEIEAAWTTVLQTTEDHVYALRGVDWSDPEQVSGLTDYLAGYSSPELDSAEAEVEAFVASSCPA